MANFTQIRFFSSSRRCTLDTVNLLNTFYFVGYSGSQTYLYVRLNGILFCTETSWR